MGVSLSRQEKMKVCYELGSIKVLCPEKSDIVCHHIPRYGAAVFCRDRRMYMLEIVLFIVTVLGAFGIFLFTDYPHMAVYVAVIGIILLAIVRAYGAWLAMSQ